MKDKTHKKSSRRSRATSSLQTLLDYSDLARITGESVMTHRRRKMLGIGPRVLRLGRHIRFHPNDVAAWLESCAQSQKAGAA
jgi:hypothetical protein